MKEKELILRKNRELEAILEVSRVLTASFDLEENLNSVMDILSGKLEMQRGCVFLPEAGTENLRIVAAHGLTKESVRKGKYRIGEGIVGRVLESNSPMFVPDIGDEPMFLNRTGSRPKKEGVSFLCIPLRHKGKAMGVISVDRIYAEEHGGVDDDLRVLKIVARMMAQFLKLWETYREADRERKSLRIELRERYSLPNLIGESPRFQAVLKSVLKVADTDATVLVLGESGTGKELIARTLHFESKRAKKPFVAVNCAALPSNLLEVELFGCEKGAFTGATAKRIGRFETAQGGSIFLDEIGELPVKLQAKLLRVLEDRTFERVGSSEPIKADVRVVAATNRDIAAEVRRGNFREDLFWRLNVVPIVLPPLRERRADVPLLVDFFREKFNNAYGKSVRVSDKAMESFVSHGWPGNVRELANTLERLIIMSETDEITPEDLPYGVAHGAARAAAGSVGSAESLKSEVVGIEKERIAKALRDHGGVQHKAARVLGITPRQLGYRIKKYGITIGS